MKEVWKTLLSVAARQSWLAPISAVLMGISGLIVGRVDWWWSALPFLAGSGGLVVEAYARRALKGSVVEFKTLLSTCLQPLARSMLALAGKTTKAEKEKALPDVLWPLLTAAISIASLDGSRASYFCRTQSEGVDSFVPHPVLSAGRGEVAVSRFAKDSDEGREVWRLAEKDEAAFYPDITKDPPLGMDTTRVRTYECFITVPVMVGGRPVGLFTINSRSANDLTGEDVGTMRMLATLTGVALTLCGGKWSSSDG